MQKFAEKKQFDKSVVESEIKGHKRCFIVGRGNTLRNFKFSLLKDEFVIGINTGFKNFHCQINFAMDFTLFSEIRNTKEWLSYKGVKLMLDMNDQVMRGTYFVKALKYYEFPKSFKRGIYHGQNSGYGALSVAYLLGFKEIYLLGYDMKLVDSEGHYDDKARGNYEKIFPKFIRAFEEIAPEYAHHGIKIFNLSPDSALLCFEKKTLGEVL